MRESLELMRRVPLLDWLTEEGAETLSSCFDLTVEELPPGQSFPTAGRIGCLLRGEAVFHRKGEARSLALGDVFALGRDNTPLLGVLTAGRDCAVAWLRADVVQHVCYNACWFHARLLEEINRN